MDRKQGKRGFNRRGFLKVVGAAGAAGAAAACSGPAPPQKLIPYLVPPENIIPGTPLFYRTVCRECSAGCGVTARTREGRVVKLEGNPDDPISRGALCGRGQAALQALYSPERIRGPMRRGAGEKLFPVGWDEAEGMLSKALAAAKEKGPGAIRLVTRPEAGSAGALQIAFLRSLGAAPEEGARVVLDPLAPSALRAAGEALFGRPELPVCDLSVARSIVSFGADFAETWLSPVELARGFAEGRGRAGPERTRFVWIGPRLSLTGVSADRWLAARAGGERALALALLGWLVDPANGVSDLAPEAETLHGRLAALDRADLARRAGVGEQEIARLGADLARRRPSAILGPGIASSGADATALAVVVQCLNLVLGNLGRTVLYGLDPLLDPPSPFTAVQALVEAMAAGEVQVLLVHHADLVGVLPSALEAARALGRVPLVASFTDLPDATTPHAHLCLPDHHTLEAFDEISPRRGIVALSQPVMMPVGDTRAASDVLLEVGAKLPFPASHFQFDDFYEFVKARVEGYVLPPAEGGSTDTEVALRAAFERGGFYSEAKPEPVALTPGAADPFLELLVSPPVEPGAGLDLVLFPKVLGRQGGASALPWASEIPDTLTNISWSTWAELAPAAAKRLGIVEGDLVSITTPAGRIELGAVVYPGLREDAIAIPLIGPEPLRLIGAATDPHSGSIAWCSTGASVGPTGRPTHLARSPGTPEEDGREIVRTVSSTRPALLRPREHQTMYSPPQHPKHRWAMAIDLDRCTGCQACVVACYAENNVPVVGPEMAVTGRNMAWLRVERYFHAAPPDEFKVDLLLMPCQHCTNAPCEPVCPVYATYHTNEGLNVQIYNRCVGTRYCSNNCPYKVRTFNWRDAQFAPPLDFQLNPDVTVRSKGVMEKCTFCVQRIRYAEIQAESEDRPVADGEIVPACAQTCPTQAIVFGDANDPGSRVAKLARDPRAYRVLEELNTQPAVTYLARVREIEP